MKDAMTHGQQELYHYTESGLDYIYLVGGVEYVEGPRGKQVIIREIDGLHNAIGRFIINERRDLTGKELRFLRHEMLMSQATLASLMNVGEQTVHRWEAGKSEIPKPAEALIRLLYNEHLGDGDNEIKSSLKRIAALEDKMDRQNLTLVDGTDGWYPEGRLAA